MYIISLVYVERIILSIKQIQSSSYIRKPHTTFVLAFIILRNSVVAVEENLSVSFT